MQSLKSPLLAAGSFLLTTEFVDKRGTFA